MMSTNHGDSFSHVIFVPGPEIGHTSHQELLALLRQGGTTAAFSEGHTWGLEARFEAMFQASTLTMARYKEGGR